MGRMHIDQVKEILECIYIKVQEINNFDNDPEDLLDYIQHIIDSLHKEVK